MTGTATEPRLPPPRRQNRPPAWPYILFKPGNAVALLAREPSRAELADPFDRVIVATARAHGMPLVSPDRALRSLASHPAAW